MKIAAVHTHVLDTKLERPFESASMRFERRQHCLVEIVTEDGVTGWGECLGPRAPECGVVAAYAPSLLGKDPLETEKIWSELYNLLRDQGQRGLTMTALSGIDIALWDLKGKHFGVPIYTLLGGKFRDSVKAYATGGFKKDGVDRATDIAAENRFLCSGWLSCGEDRDRFRCRGRPRSDRRRAQGDWQANPPDDRRQSRL